jgi:hypothetical protein
MDEKKNTGWIAFGGIALGSLALIVSRYSRNSELIIDFAVLAIVALFGLMQYLAGRSTAKQQDSPPSEDQLDLTQNISSKQQMEC